MHRHLGFLALFLWSSALAGQFTGTCDGRNAGRDKCLDWLHTSLKTMGCEVSNASAAQACRLHPWGSDFIKSWICTLDSKDCAPASAPNETCPAGSVLVVNQGFSACRKVLGTSHQFVGVCHHPNPSQTLNLTDCSKIASHCASLGGETERVSVYCEKGAFQGPMEVTTDLSCKDVAQKCTSSGGTTLHDWALTCRFRDMEIDRTGSSCQEIRARCERSNSPKGVKGSLKSCFLAD